MVTNDSTNDSTRYKMGNRVTLLPIMVTVQWVWVFYDCIFAG